MLRNTLDETTERLRDTKFQLFTLNQENEALKAERQSHDVALSERAKAESERSEKEVKRLRRKIEHLEEERRESDRLQERVIALDNEARLSQETIKSLESKLAAQSDQLRKAEEEFVRSSSSGKALDDERKREFEQLRALLAQSSTELESMRKEASRSMENALVLKTQSQAEESRLTRELEDVKQRSRDEIASLRENVKALEKQSHDFELQALRSEALRSELESLRKTNEHLITQRENEGSLSPTLVFLYS